MNLLTKESVVKEKAVERKLDIDEGLKLAKKIDELRHKFLDEERKFNLFKEASLSFIRKDMKETIENLQNLKSEIQELTIEKKKLLDLINSVKEL